MQTDNKMATNLDQLFKDFRRMRVLIVGDVMVDAYIFGGVDRLSPEAPVPVVNVDKEENRLGGAGNVALNILALGAQPVLCTVIGKDKEAEILKGLLKASGIPLHSLVESEDRKTTCKTRVIGNNHQLLRIDHEMTANLKEIENFLLIEAFDRALDNADVVILEDYNKGVLNTENISAIIEKAHKKNVPVAVDPKILNFLEYKGVTLFKPNLKEMREGLGLKDGLKDDESMKAAVKQLSDKLGNQITMVTLSERGVYITDKSTEHLIPAHLRNIADVSGAGDTVIRVAALCLALNTEIGFLAALSNLAGGLVCEETGVVPVSKDRLLDEAKRIGL